MQDRRTRAARRWLDDPAHRLVAWDDADYPRSLLDLADPPLALYAIGRVELLSRPAIAIVGSRQATPQGVEDAQAFARTLAEAGLTVISGSPERFLASAGDRVETRPIKGTRARMPGGAEELAAADKDGAEHLMIVDLERNDLGRIAETGSVRVDELGYVVELPALYHKVSRVSAKPRAGIGYGGLLRATFPGGSITGAPKVRAMELIDELEPARRGPYCGAFGYFVAFPTALRFLLAWIVESHLTPIIDTGEYLTLFLTIVVAFGLSFQIPAIVFVLSRIGLISARFLVAKLKYAVFACLVAAAVLVGVVHQVPEGTFERELAALHDTIVLDNQQFGRSLRLRQCVLEQIGERQRLELVLMQTGLRTRQRQKILEESPEVVELGIDQQQRPA